MSSSPEVIVVGGGSNSLTAACYLAKAGKHVLILEKNEDCGGAVHSVEPAPGFIGDPCATAMVLCHGNPTLAKDELELEARFGLEWMTKDASFSTIFDDGTGLLTWKDLDRCCEGISQFSQKDAEVYRRFVLDGQALLPLTLKGMFLPPPSLGAFISMLEQSTIGSRMVTSMFSSAYDVVEGLFESPELKIHILKWVGELMMAPESKGTGMIPSMLLGMAHAYPMTAVVGGSQNLTAALERCFESHGGTIRRNAEVVKINVSAGKATGVTLSDGEVVDAREAVIGSIHPWDLGEMIPEVDSEIAEAARAVKLSDYSTINQQYALEEPPHWKAGSEYSDSMMIECVKRDLPGVRRAFDHYRYGTMPWDHLSPLIAVHSNFDHSRAPAGKASMYLYHFAPMYLADSGLAGWDSVREEYADRIFEEMCKYTTNLDRSKIVGRYVATPLDYDRRSKLMRHGDIFGVASGTSQFMGRRPIPELAQFTVPGLESFYLAGCTQHPGGGVTLGGRAVAVKMMMDWDMDLADHFAII